ncbi:MAG TPA: hypothetical protein VFJ74_16410 [Gemmatimonadaceae bacterium]|nr:hypothetical protein [Gemmatimonadaceae bacterium]
MQPERRRAGWREFRHAYPGILATMGVALAALVALDAWLVYKRTHYREEIARLRAGMSVAERHRADVVLAADERRMQVMVELAKRQALGDKELHLSVSVDSGLMHLEREGAILRDMQVEVGPEKRVGEPPDTLHMAAPRGTRRVEKVLDASDAWEVPRWVYADRGLAVPEDRALKGALGPAAVILDGGTVVYTMPTVGPLNDSTYVMPGSVRVRASDLRAVVPDLKPGMTVYFY